MQVDTVQSAEDSGDTASSLEENNYVGTMVLSKNADVHGNGREGGERGFTCIRAGNTETKLWPRRKGDRNHKVFPSTVPFHLHFQKMPFLT